MHVTRTALSVLVAIVLISACSDERAAFVGIAIPSEPCDIHAQLSWTPDAKRWIVFTHGNRAGGQAHPLYQAIRRMFPSSYNVLALNLVGYGASRCAHAVDGYSPDRTGDILEAIEFLERGYGIERRDVTLVGHSLGAVLSVSAGNRRPDVAVIAMGPGDFTKLLSHCDDIDRYRKKIERMTGLLPSRRAILEFKEDLAPEHILLNRSSENTVAIVTGHDIADLLTENGSVGAGSIAEVTVPWADHMYGTERHSTVGELKSRVYLMMLERVLTSVLKDVGSSESENDD